MATKLRPLAVSVSWSSSPLDGLPDVSRLACRLSQRVASSQESLAYWARYGERAHDIRMFRRAERTVRAAITSKSAYPFAARKCFFAPRTLAR